MAAATRGLRPLLGPLRPAVRAPRTTTPGLSRAQSNVRDQIRESTKRSYKEMKRGDVKAPSPSADMAAQTDMMRNRMLLPGVYSPPCSSHSHRLHGPVQAGVQKHEYMKLARGEKRS